MTKGLEALMFFEKKGMRGKNGAGGNEPNQEKRTMTQLWARFKETVSYGRKIEKDLEVAGDDEPTQKLVKPKALHGTGPNLLDLVITTKRVTVGVQSESEKNDTADPTSGDSEFVEMLVGELLQAKRREDNGGN